MRRRLILPLVPGLVQRGGLNPALGAEAELNTTERGSMHQRKLDDHRRSNRHFAMASRRVALIVLCLLVLLALGPAAANAVAINDGTVGTGTNQFEFVGSGWHHRPSGQPSYLGDDHYSKVAGSYYRVRFSGTYAKVYTAKGLGAGIAAISIDGGAETLVDLYAPSRQNQVLVYSSPTLVNAPHILKVRVTGTKNPYATDSYVIADRVDVGAEAAPLWRSVLYDRFDSGGVPSYWRPHDFRYRTSDNCASPSHVSVSGGYLRLLMRYETSGWCGAGWYTGGLTLAKVAPYASVDQRITVRFRVVNGGVIAHRIIPMRWPTTASQPGGGEEDYCESHDLTFCASFFHSSWGRINKSHIVNLTQWHTFRFERRNYVVRVWIDDMSTPVWTYYGSSTTLPATLKAAVLQQECQPLRVGGCPTGKTGYEEIQIDWITIENPA